MRRFINPLFVLFACIPKLLISKLSAVSNPLV